MLKELIKKNKKFLIGLFFIIFVFILSFNLGVYYKDKKYKKILLKRENKIKEIQEKKEKEIEKKKMEMKKKWEILEKMVEAYNFNSIIVRDLEKNEVIFAKNERQIFPIASLTKIMTAIVSLEKFQNENKIYVTKRALNNNGYYGLRLGEVFDKKKAIDFMLIQSANDMAAAISYGPVGNIAGHWKKFLNEMNSFTKKQNWNSSLFFSETGLDVNNYIMGSYSSAYDISLLSEYFLKKFPELAFNTTKKEAKICSNLTCHKIKNTNILLEKYPEIIFSKTGYTKKSKASVSVIIKLKNKLYSIVVIGADDKMSRFLILEKLIDGLKLLNSKQ